MSELLLGWNMPPPLHLSTVATHTLRELSPQDSTGAESVTPTFSHVSVVVQCADSPMQKPPPGGGGLCRNSPLFKPLSLPLPFAVHTLEGRILPFLSEH